MIEEPIETAPMDNCTIVEAYVAEADCWIKVIWITDGWYTEDGEMIYQPVKWRHS